MLEPADLDPDPLAALAAWFAEARARGVPQPETMALATADASGAPSVRFVLLRGVGPDGLVFYTNRESRKGGDLAVNPRAAVAVYWHELGRQVRAEGPVERTSDAESVAYFDTRPRPSRISAWSSPQSRPVTREELDAAVAATEARFAGRDDVPLPPFWGGYRLRPVRMEFWQQGAARLHDRVEYRRDGAGWARTRLAP